MEFAVSIDEITKKINVHALSCSFSRGNKQNDVSQYHHSYDEAWDWISKKELVEEYKSEDCICCNPGNWNQI